MSLNFRSLNQYSCFLQNKIFLSCIKSDHCFKLNEKTFTYKKNLLFCSYIQNLWFCKSFLRFVSHSLTLLKIEENKKRLFFKKNAFQIFFLKKKKTTIADPQLPSYKKKVLQNTKCFGAPLRKTLFFLGEHLYFSKSRGSFVGFPFFFVFRAKKPQNTSIWSANLPFFFAEQKKEKVFQNTLSFGTPFKLPLEIKGLTKTRFLWMFWKASNFRKVVRVFLSALLNGFFFFFAYFFRSHQQCWCYYFFFDSAPLPLKKTYTPPCGNQRRHKKMVFVDVLDERRHKNKVFGNVVFQNTSYFITSRNPKGNLLGNTWRKESSYSTLGHNKKRFFCYTKSTFKNYKHSNLINTNLIKYTKKKKKYTKKISLKNKLYKFIRSIKARLLAKLQQKHYRYKKPKKKKRSYKISYIKSLKKKIFKKISKKKKYKKSCGKVFFNRFIDLKAEYLEQLRKLRRFQLDSAKRVSTFKQKLEEKKKISLLYGNLGKTRFQKIYQEALKYRGKINENLLVLLESRLDVILYRICFFRTLYKARQWIQHKKIKINGQIVTLPHYKLQRGDVITAQSKKILEVEMRNDLKTKVDRFSKRYHNQTFLKYKLMTLYRTPNHYSFFLKCIQLKKKLKKNLLRDVDIRRKNLKKKKMKFFFFNAKKKIKKLKKRRKLRKTKVKKFVLKLNSYLKKVIPFFLKKHTNNKNTKKKNTNLVRLLIKPASEKFKLARTKKKKLKFKVVSQVEPKFLSKVYFQPNQNYFCVKGVQPVKKKRGVTKKIFNKKLKVSFTCILLQIDSPFSKSSKKPQLFLNKKHGWKDQSLSNLNTRKVEKKKTVKGSEPYLYIRGEKVLITFQPAPRRYKKIVKEEERYKKGVKGDMSDKNKVKADMGNKNRIFLQGGKQPLQKGRFCPATATVSNQLVSKNLRQKKRNFVERTCLKKKRRLKKKAIFFYSTKLLLRDTLTKIRGEKVKNALIQNKIKSEKVQSFLIFCGHKKKKKIVKGNGKIIIQYSTGSFFPLSKRNVKKKKSRSSLAAHFFANQNKGEKKIFVRSTIPHLQTPTIVLKKKERRKILKKEKLAFFRSQSKTFFLKAFKTKFTTKDLLKIRKHFIKPRERVVKKAALSFTSSMKPLHIEVSYKLLTAIFVFSPQFLTFPVSLDMDLIVRSFSQG